MASRAIDSFESASQGNSVGFTRSSRTCLATEVYVRPYLSLIFFTHYSLHMAFSTVAYTGLAGVALYVVSHWWNNRIPRGLKRPPGPPGRLLIGNLLDLPKSKEWVTFDRWAKEYGDLCYLSMPGASILFVNSHELAKELFDKRGSIYSGRYQSTVLNDLIKLDWAMVFAQYGERWRRNRTYFHQFFNQTAVENYHDIQLKYTKVLLKRLYHSPEDYRTHVRYISGASILEVSYGIQPMSETDPFIVLSETTIQRATEAGIPGTYLVDIFPFRTKFQTELGQLGEQVIEMLNKPVEVAKNNMRNGRPSMVSALIETFENDPNRPDDYEDLIKHVPGVAYIAAVDTVSAQNEKPSLSLILYTKSNGILLQFFHMMLLHPEVQKRAQEELEEVVGPGALPSFKDFGKLKYVRAIFLELLRCNTVVPIAVPHVLNVDDVVNGYFIPKGTIVFGNSWTLLRSKSLYGPDADKFNPERFLDERTPYPDFAFGYGRRACPGQYFGENSILITIANVLHLFHILPFEGENGPELPAEDHFDSGVILKPKPFKCRIIPRSPGAAKTLEELDH
ncbi:hypothetical protein Clacol_005266 [Clathrus columnatus]|uniref:Cytochrome P450 n=1 Tax=Clathrus columnatus TaxID=1419009 RepID=A0AAV5AGG7_9AGAM|nr:hypothetical protein Clacol_005266 [Clathrus columnatus]